MAETPPLIDLKNIEFSYPKGENVLKGVNLLVSIDDKVALTGFNGSGKTTILNIIMGLIKPTGGTVTLLGKKCQSEKDFAPIRPLLGYVFQDANDQLFCPTVGDDIAFGPLNMGSSYKEAEEITIDVLERLGLTGFGQRVTHDLSGGEKKLVALGTALALKPKMLILDEPTTFLDRPSRERLLELMGTLSLPFLIVSHDFDFLQKTGCRYLELDDGVIVDRGNKPVTY
ncbi:MAG: energy-coupling factor ABC transporter ATP-binding protein [Deltaproteobacteria bacterium]|jgi:cobalt/nickel transport system ATP-binding protein|nr:energy-coupling factor ABC transporter ATP-binding protein [Deltaproteobacteria bacterium]